MRILLFDEAFLGHHAVWMEQVLRAIHDIAPQVNLSYAFPHAFDVTAEHVAWREPAWHHVFRKVQACTGRPWLAAAKWRSLVRLAKEARADRVVMLYADEFLHPSYAPKVDFQWVPIYFHPRFLRGYSDRPPLATLQAKSCPFIYVLDAGVRASLSNMVGKPVVRIPDFCPTEYGHATARCASVEDAAAGKPVVGAIGPVTRHKNIGTLIAVAKNRPDWHFLIAGLLFPRALSVVEQRLVDEARDMANVSCFFDYLPHDELNALTAMCTVQFAAYRRFPHSSNKLVRACAYRTPLVVAQDGCMGEMVAHYGIGQLCDPASTASVEDAIDQSLAMNRSLPNWGGCLAANSLTRLREALAPVVADDIVEAANVIAADVIAADVITSKDDTT